MVHGIWFRQFRTLVVCAGRRAESEPAPQSSSLLSWIKKTVAGEERNDLNHLRAILEALGPCESSSDDVIRMKAEKVRRELTDAVEIRKE